jgi:hypothetical protein
MANWKEIEDAAPGFAARVRACFDAGTNKTIATLRADGSPRISGTELAFEGDDITFGVMPRAMKLFDLRRDPRTAIHSPTIEPPTDVTKWLGDAKVAGRVRALPEPAGSPTPDASFFALDIGEVVLTRVGDPQDHLVIESWHPGRGMESRKRY